MKHRISFGLVLIAIGATSVLAAPSQPLQARALSQSSADTAATPTDWSSAKRRKAQPRPPLRIACTQEGCIPVPPGCTTGWVKDWDDNLTGMEYIVCPPR